uniref:Uncharacterized protein n=1 Tax=Steinernema glaseri TaxID=37863 RepID=A0A1I7ZHR5_9BILA
MPDGHATSLIATRDSAPAVGAARWPEDPSRHPGRDQGDREPLKGYGRWGRKASGELGIRRGLGLAGGGPAPDPPRGPRRRRHFRCVADPSIGGNGNDGGRLFLLHPALRPGGGGPLIHSFFSVSFLWTKGRIQMSHEKPSQCCFDV